MRFGTGDIEKKSFSFWGGVEKRYVGGLEYPEGQWKFIVEGKKKFVQALMISCCEWRRLVGVL